MRRIYSVVIVVFAAATIVFALQNLETVTVSFLRFSISAPLAILVFIIYVLGAVTGGGVLALLRRTYKGSRGPVMSS